MAGRAGGALNADSASLRARVRKNNNLLRRAGCPVRIVPGGATPNTPCVAFCVLYPASYVLCPMPYVLYVLYVLYYVLYVVSVLLGHACHLQAASNRPQKPGAYRVWRGHTQ